MERAAKIRRTDEGTQHRDVMKTHNDLGPPFTDDYFPYSKGQIERAYASRRYDDHKRAWNTYYQSNTINGYKDRHYILREFVELNDELVKCSGTVASVTPHHPISVRWLEVGCGVGNAVMPALKEHPHLAVCGFDISSVAINLFRKKAEDEGLADRVTVCVLNLADEDVPNGFLLKGPQTPPANNDASALVRAEQAAGLVDFASIIFVLSAIQPSKYVTFLKRARSLMRTGGVLFFRDYFENDMAQKRFSKENKIDDSTFFRVDGTLSHFFNRSELRQLFTEENGFSPIEEKVVEREVENRKEQSTMHRRWYQGRFRCV